MLIRPGERGKQGQDGDAQVRERSDPRRVRLFALLGVVTAAVALPLAVASAGPAGDRDRAAVPDRAGGLEGSAVPDRSVARTLPQDDGKRPAPEGSPLAGLGLATAVRCGPQLSSHGGVEAQTCVMTQGGEVWGRTYYRNATGERLASVLSFMGPDGRSVEMHCAVEAVSDPGACETPRQRLAARPQSYSAIAEFAGEDGEGPLLLRSGSDAAGASAR
ncbi:hypothetical protein ACWEQ1_06205 [Streptomyces nodosus]